MHLEPTDDATLDSMMALQSEIQKHPLKWKRMCSLASLYHPYKSWITPVSRAIFACFPEPHSLKNKVQFESPCTHCALQQGRPCQDVAVTRCWCEQQWVWHKWDETRFTTRSRSPSQKRHASWPFFEGRKRCHTRTSISDHASHGSLWISTTSHLKPTTSWWIRGMGNDGTGHRTQIHRHLSSI